LNVMGSVFSKRHKYILFSCKAQTFGEALVFCLAEAQQSQRLSGYLCVTSLCVRSSICALL
jgi:hypothetical protein